MASIPAALALEATTAASRARAVSAPAVRIAAVDLVRGLAIVVMALDHVREYFSDAAFMPTDLERTTVAHFLTRWITHFCAPAFVLLAGTSAWLMSQRMSRGALSRFLLKRGAVLVLLEWTVVTFAWTFNVDYRLGLIMQVIWVIGVSMMLLAALLHLPVRIVVVLGLLLVAGHNLFDGIRPEDAGALAPLWQVLHVQGVLRIAGTPVGFVHYPLLPWAGVMMLGYGLGTLYSLDGAARRRRLVLLGLAACVAFVVVRALDGYGDPKPWTPQRDAVFTALAFLNTSKYPPSLAYLLMTLGPILLLLAWAERWRGALATLFDSFGRVPLFAYVAHLVLAHLLAGLTAMAMGFGTTVLTEFFLFHPEAWGVGLGAVYLFWLLVLALLLPACRGYARVKRAGRYRVLAYL